MQRNTLKVILIIIMVFCSIESYAYCVWNKTIGNDTYQGKLSFKPWYGSTKLYMVSNAGWEKAIKQNDYRCDRTKDRSENATSIITIKFIAEDSFTKTRFEPVCIKEVYNARGYIVISGYAGNFSCNVYRDVE